MSKMVLRNFTVQTVFRIVPAVTIPKGYRMGYQLWCSECRSTCAADGTYIKYPMINRNKRYQRKARSEYIGCSFITQLIYLI